MWDKFISFFNSIVIHGLLFAILVISITWQKIPEIKISPSSPEPEQPVMQAVAMNEEQWLATIKNNEKTSVPITKLEQSLIDKRQALNELRQQKQLEVQRLALIKQRQVTEAAALEKFKREQIERRKLEKQARLAKIAEEKRRQIAEMARLKRREKLRRAYEATEQARIAKEKKREAVKLALLARKQRRDAAERARLAREKQRRAARRARLIRERKQAAKRAERARSLAQKRQTQLAKERARRIAEEKKLQAEEDEKKKLVERKKLDEDKAKNRKTLIKTTVKNIQTQVLSKWIRPRGANNNTSCVIELRVKSNGVISSVIVSESSGDKVFDQSAVVAIRRSSPLPIPAELSDTFKHFKFTFRPK
ncbi:cell envelope integrity protein TolA [Candidatus Marithrix sp. Canyon 246]|uniref:cell envelope integrity protein TolA n=1 Tax=Candidatus Marithrix sp. Canyon 246 TaxID=1827136 RepID=UPI00084A1073|nr:cell envelope integrity protein TolA [Candidatus Marithrix sp. Canyon 246]